MTAQIEETTRVKHMPHSDEGAETSVSFDDTTLSLSETLDDVARTLPKSTRITLHDLLAHIGEQGLLVFCLLLIIPFLLPVSIPGVSTVFGVAILLIGIGVLTNRIPWLPKRLMHREIDTDHLIPALQKGAKFFSRIERLVRPRLVALTHGITINRINGLMLIYSALLLMAPFGAIPLTNTLPALAIVGLAVGILQRDGYSVIFGYLMAVATTVYFAALVFGALAAGHGLANLLAVIALF